VATAPALAVLPPDRLVALAAAASRSAAASARLELHPDGMEPARAIALARGTLLGADALTIEEVQRRVASRFPAAAPLPGRPGLDALLEAASVELRWDERTEHYQAPAPTPILDLTSHRSSTRVTALAAGNERLHAAAAAGGLLVLMTEPRRLVAAGGALRQLPVHPIDVDALVLTALRERAEARGVRWERVLLADAARPGQPDWTRLITLVREASRQVESTIAAHEGVVLLEHVGLLARYGEVGMIERLRAATQDGAALRGLWVLVPADKQTDRPSIGGVPIPVLGPNERLRIPKTWLAVAERQEAAA
jgi:hypothetical protein